MGQDRESREGHRVSERREASAKRRELGNDRRHERWLALFGVLALVPVGVIVLLRVLFP